MRRLDQIAALAMLLFATAAVLDTREIALWTDGAPGGRFMPLIVAGIIAALALVLAWQASTSPSGPVDWPDRLGARRVTYTAISIVGFVVASLWIGFLASALLLVLVMLLAIERRYLLPSLLAAAVTGVIVQGVFVWWLGVALPKGFLGI